MTEDHPCGCARGLNFNSRPDRSLHLSPLPAFGPEPKRALAFERAGAGLLAAVFSPDVTFGKKAVSDAYGIAAVLGALLALASISAQADELQINVASGALSGLASRRRASSRGNDIPRGCIVSTGRHQARIRSRSGPSIARNWSTCSALRTSSIGHGRRSIANWPTRCRPTGFVSWRPATRTVRGCRNGSPMTTNRWHVQEFGLRVNDGPGLKAAPLFEAYLSSRLQPVKQ